MAENVLEVILIGLVNHGIKKVIVSYSGGGDEGAIDEILVTTNPNEDFSDAVINLNDYDSGLYSLLEDYCTEKLLEIIEDWYNGEGGHGCITIDVEKGTYEIENNIRVVEYEEYIHTGKLFEKNTK
jgi:hypothetical protein